LHSVLEIMKKYVLNLNPPSKTTSTSFLHPE